MSLAPANPAARKVRTATLGLLVSASLSALGVALAGTVSGPLVAGLTLVGWAGLLGSLHAFGRAGRS